MLRTTVEWGKPIFLIVILSKPKARRRIRNPVEIRCGPSRAYGIREVDNESLCDTAAV